MGGPVGPGGMCGDAVGDKVRFNQDVFRVARAVVNKTQKDVAQEVGIHPTTMTEIIKHGAEPKVGLARRIAQAVNLTVEELWPFDE